MGHAFRFGFIIPAPLEVEAVELQINSRPLGLLNRFKASQSLDIFKSGDTARWQRHALYGRGSGFSSVIINKKDPLRAETVTHLV